MVDGDGRIWRVQDPERFNARFRVVHQMVNVALIAGNGARRADMKAYAKECPAEAEKLLNLQKIGRVSAVSAALGFVGSATAVWRWTRTPALVVVTGVFGTIAATLAGEDVASLVLGTYKFDNHKAWEDFYTWKNERDGVKPAQH